MTSDDKGDNHELPKSLTTIIDDAVFDPEDARFTEKTVEDIGGTEDDPLSLAFIDKNHNTIRYIGQWNKWMMWDGAKWKTDNMLATYKHAREYLRSQAAYIKNRIYKSICKEMSPKLSTDEKLKFRKLAKRHASKQVRELLRQSKVHAISWLARCDGRVATEIDWWDKDPYLLNTPDGTVNLHTGKMCKHNPLDYITKATAVAPSLAPPVKWLEFLNTIMHDDQEMVRYLQKIFGYCLVGDVKEHQMYFAYGTGANGKGVTLNTMRSIMGDYGIETPIQTFMLTSSDRHPTEIADLRGARLVTCGETDAGQRWAEARIKSLTGGDPVKARFMRQDFFQYQPQFTLFIAGNHKPRLTNVDEAIARRFRLIPFTYTVPRPERDVDLFDKLKEEWPSILNWAIEGCMMWQAEGLDAPAAVAHATKAYLSQEDALTAWYEECCIQDANVSTHIKDLFNSWSKWAGDNGEPAGTKRTLTLQIEDREPIWRIQRIRRNDGVAFTGIALVEPAELK